MSELTPYRDLSGRPLTIAGANDELERLEHRIRQLDRELQKNYDRRQLERIRAKRDRFEREHSFLWGQMNPSWSDDSGYIGDGIALTDLQPCRAAESGGCLNRVTSRFAFDHAGYCGDCFRTATDPIKFPPRQPELPPPAFGSPMGD